MTETMTAPDPSALPAPATPAIPGDPWTSLDWMKQRARLLEEQRQTLHCERDEARARAVDLEDRHRTDKAMVEVLHGEIAEWKDISDRRDLEIARLRAHLAAAGLALDELTAPDAARDDA